MIQKLTIEMVAGPVLFCVAVYFSWTFGRLYFCGIEM